MLNGKKMSIVAPDAIGVSDKVADEVLGDR